MPRQLLIVLLLLAACAAPPAAQAPTAPPIPTAAPSPTPRPPGLVVDPAAELGPISPLVFGTNTGPWTGIPLDMQDEVRASGLTLLRFPGGNWGDENDMRDYQLDPFLELCRAEGYEPMLSVRLLGGSPASAAELVRYVNITKQYGVRYWSIGNEPSLYESRRQVAGYDTTRYNQEWRAIAEAMRAVDPSIVLVGPDTHQFELGGGPNDSAGRSWVGEFLKANGDMVGVVAIHRYPFPSSLSDSAPDPEALRASSADWDTLIPALRELTRESAGRDIPLAITEVNSNWTGAALGKTTPDSHLGAIWWADSLARMIRQRVEIVAHFAIHGPRREGWGLVEKYKVRPAYHVYPLLRRLGETLLSADSDDPDVTVVAARRADGALTIALVNRAAAAKELPLNLGGLSPGGPAERYLLAQETPGERLDDLPPTQLDRLSLPAESLTVLVIPIE
jgi:hypothetical protein